jgi:hypothetical protein
MSTLLRVRGESMMGMSAIQLVEAMICKGIGIPMERAEGLAALFLCVFVAYLRAKHFHRQTLL